MVGKTICLKKPLYYKQIQELFCDSGRIRTFDLQLRRLLLYPAELRNRYVTLSNDL